VRLSACFSRGDIRPDNLIEMQKKKVAVIGATGYTGSEIVRILARHPGVELAMITSESRTGEKFSDVHPFFQGIVDDELQSAEALLSGSASAADPDLVFLALPHGVSMDYVKRLAGRGLRIIDFSGDFRLGSPEVYEAWYPKKHVYPEGFVDAVYGLPELFADRIGEAKLVANPGCFPTGALLALAPLFASGMLTGERLIIDSKTGVTGAGVKATSTNMFSNVHDNFKAYGVKTHRHTIEIQGILEVVARSSGMTEPDGWGAVGGTAGDESGDTSESRKGPVVVRNSLAPVQFTPHLLPVDRGILTTAYAHPEKTVTAAALQELYHRFYRDKPFVRMCDAPPAVKDVRASNYCNIYVDYDERTGNLIVISAIDNLVKGAAGLAVQNMNVMFGWDETIGLDQIPLQP
jgi:N-acetyl-gamma-glutamyl-phosphate reductase